MRTLGVGLVGYGFIGKVHALGYQSIPFYYEPAPCKVKLVGVCTAHKETYEKAVEQAGFEFGTTDFRDLVKREDIDIIDCCAPNFLHRDVLIESMRAGKNVYCEKPLAMNLSEAAEIVQVAGETKVKNQIAFQYRFIPATMRAKQLIQEGFLGNVFSFRVAYLHSGYIDPERPMSWRLDKSQGGGGALYDIGSHILDLIRFLLGDFARVYAVTETFIKERPIAKGAKEKTKVEVDDLAILLLHLKNGVVGTVEASRVATGAQDEIRLEVHGSRGAISFNSMDPNWLSIYDVRDASEPIGGLRGFKKVETVQRYPKPAAIPGDKFAIGWIRYHFASLYQFLKNVVEDLPCSPDFHDGLKVQEIMEAAYESAAKNTWMEI